MRVGRFDLAFDLVAREQRNIVGVGLELAVRVARHEALHVLLRLLECRLIIDQDLADIVGQIVAQRARDRVALLIDEKGRAARPGRLVDRLPLGLEVIQIPLQLSGSASDAGRAHDRAHGLGHDQLAHDLAHLVALFTLDTPRDPTGARVVGHEHQEAAGQTDESRERSALIAALLFLDLNHDLLAFLDELTDVQAPALRRRAKIIPGYFLQRQKAVPRGPVIDEGRFERGLDAGDTGLIDVGFLLFSGWYLDAQVIEFLSIDQCHPQFFLLGSVD